ncbi:MAG: DUF72 domain-containing protein [Treponema sp.]|nr:DUF72 domain-containing protein [Treponema sp.]
MYGQITHEIDLAKWQDIAKQYLQAVEPLREVGRLEVVLFQFPYSFHYEAENRRYMDGIQAISLYTYAGASWVSSSTGSPSKSGVSS